MSSAAVTVAGFVLFALAGVGLELAARRPRSRLPRLGDVLSLVTSTGPGRVALLLCWWWLGWHFLVRSTV